MNLFQKNNYLLSKDKSGDVAFFWFTGAITWEQALKWLKIKRKGIKLV